MPTNETSLKSNKREFPFHPRIINPVKIKNAVIFSADEQIRQTKTLLEKEMPWIAVEILSDPISVNNYESKGATIFILDDVAMNLILSEPIKQRNPDSVFALLSANEFIHCSPPSVAQEKYPYTQKADLVFAYNKTDCAPEKIIQSIVRSAEDLLNITKYAKVRRFIFLIMDDEPRWISQFLPILYGIIGQRAAVMIARTYEESVKFIFGVEQESDIDDSHYRSSGHGDDVVCLITDIFFPMGDDLKSNAGKNLIRLVQKFYLRIRIIVASKTKEAEAYRETAFILPKGDPDSLNTLRSYIQDHTGIGDFLIRNREGDVLYRIKNIQEMIEVLNEAEKNTPEALNLRKILEIYGENDYFSTWLYMHSFRELGDVLRPIRAEGHTLVNLLKEHMQDELSRMEFTPLIIDGKKAFNLGDLFELLKISDPSKIQALSNNDIFSSWLDRKGYSQLADEFRPIHGTGKSLADTLTAIIEKWSTIVKKKPTLPLP
ncbi:hypothetical protein ACFLT2_04320 [Acidobacteriota bacterium]